jgi:hypothetical protein
MASVEIKGDLGQRLAIEVHGYENEAAADVFDANWLRCAVELELGAFRGAAELSLATSDFASWLVELEQSLRQPPGSASFKTLEDGLQLTAHIDDKGRASVAGILRQEAGSGTALQFAFETDQTFLQTTLAELRRVVAAFPEKT